MPAWPASFPRPVREGFNYSPDSAVAATDMDSGPPRVRRTTSNPGRHMVVSFMATPEQFDLFEAWFHHELKDGANWFSMPVRIGAKTLDLQVLSDPKSMWSPEFTGRYVRVMFPLLVRDKPIMSAAELAPYL